MSAIEPLNADAGEPEDDSPMTMSLGAAAATFCVQPDPGFAFTYMLSLPSTLLTVYVTKYHTPGCMGRLATQNPLSEGPPTSSPFSMAIQLLFGSTCGLA